MYKFWFNVPNKKIVNIFFVHPLKVNSIGFFPTKRIIIGQAEGFKTFLYTITIFIVLNDPVDNSIFFECVV